MSSVVAAFAVGLVNLSAHALCWIDAEHTRADDNIPTTDERVATSRQLAQRIHAIVKGNDAMQSLQGTRVRSRWQIGHGAGVPARSIWYQARDHRQPMWVGECAVLEGADRWSPRASLVTSSTYGRPRLAAAGPEWRTSAFRSGLLVQQHEIECSTRVGGPI